MLSNQNSFVTHISLICSKRKTLLQQSIHSFTQTWSMNKQLFCKISYEGNTFFLSVYSNQHNDMPYQHLHSHPQPHRHQLPATSIGIEMIKLKWFTNVALSDIIKIAFFVEVFFFFCCIRGLWVWDEGGVLHPFTLPYVVSNAI